MSAIADFIQINLKSNGIRPLSVEGKKEGHWVLLDGDDFGQAGGTIVYYELYLDPGKLVPKALVRHNLGKDVPNVLRQLKAHAQKLHTESSTVAAATVED